jgi:hypothetical protein
MDPSIVVAGISAGSALYSSWKNRQGVKMANETDRATALADWERQNKYNDPSQQMARLKAAGLNPNLVYGKGVTGNSADAVKQYSTRPEQYDNSVVGNALTSYQAVQMQQQKITNMENVNKNLELEQGLKALKATQLGISNETNQFKKEQMERMSDILVQNMVLKNNLIQTQTNKTATDNEIALYMKEPNKQKAISQMLMNRSQTELIDLKKLETKANTLRIEANTVTEGKKQAYIGQQLALIEQDIAKKKQEVTNLEYQSHNILLKGQAQVMDNRLKALGINEKDPFFARMLGQMVFGSLSGNWMQNLSGNRGSLEDHFNKSKGKTHKTPSSWKLKEYKSPYADDPSYIPLNRK